MIPLLRSILFCRQDRLGDLVLSLPLAAAVKRVNPEIKVGFLVAEGMGDLVSCCREVDEVWEASADSKLDKQRLREWQAAVVLWPRPKLARQLFFARVDRRIGTSRRAYSVFFNERVKLHRHGSGRHETALNFDLLEQVMSVDRTARPSFVLPDDAMEYIRDVLGQHGFDPGLHIAVLHPGSGKSSRDWQVENFEAVADILSHRADTYVVITGSRDERKLASHIVKSNPKKIITLSGDTTLPQLMALLRCASVMLANSTGPLHLANALGTPTVGLFPPLVDCNRERWGVLDHPERSLMPEFPEVDCPFCKANACPKGECMRLISPQRVLEAVEPLLEQSEGWSKRLVP